MTDDNFDMNKMRDIEFQVDTVANTLGAAAYYSPSRNTITANYKKDSSESFNRYNQSRETITHEQKHRDNSLKGIHAWPVSPEQGYKLEMHDEISAMMTEIISLRDEYIKTGDIHVFDSLPKGKFYVDAITNGEIKPGSPYQEDFDKEMRLIVNGSQKVWLETWGNDFYVDNGVCHGLQSDCSGAYAKYHDQNYEKGKKIAYNIGGVDFTQYMDKDVEIPENGKEALNEALKHGLINIENGYQEFLASSCDFFGLRPEQTQGVIESAQGQKGVAGKIMAPVGATLTAAFVGSYNRLKNAYHKIIPPENEQTHPVNTSDPKYRKWKDEDGSRVSEVQHRQILDMNQTIIKKPTKSYASENKGNTSDATSASRVSGRVTIPQIDLSDQDMFVQYPSSIKINRPIEASLPQRQNSVKLNLGDTKVQLKKDKANAMQLSGRTDFKTLETLLNEQQQASNKFWHENFEKILSGSTGKVSQTTAQKDKPKTDKVKEKIGQDTQQASHKYRQKMIEMIQYMNKVNGPKKSIDAQKTTETLCQKFGDDAYNLLLKAIKEPTNYSQITGEKSIKTSREAVQHLCNMENNSQTSTMIRALLSKER